MRRLLPALLLCAGCAPDAGDDKPPEPPAQTYSTQTTAPAPDYRQLIAEAATADGWRERAATAPLPADAKAVGDRWVARLKARGALLGYGLAGKGADGPVSLIDTGLTEAEFDAWVRENGWAVPAHIRWSFVPPLRLPAVSDAARRAIRVWPASTTRTGVQNQALFHGRVELRDGCFYVGELGQPVDRLAWFHAEVGLDVDGEGYLVLRDRVSGQTLARLGETMNWGGPATAEIDPARERALRQACGPAPLHVVGTPEASERFLTQHPHLRSPEPPPRPPASAATDGARAR